MDLCGWVSTVEEDHILFVVSEDLSEIEKVESRSFVALNVDPAVGG